MKAKIKIKTSKLDRNEHIVCPAPFQELKDSETFRLTL
jgi:hypothetical protein